MRQQIRMDIKDDVDENGEVTCLWDAYKAVLRGKIIGYALILKNQKERKIGSVTNRS